MPSPDLTDLSIILAVVVLVFGAAKFPSLGERLGRRLSRRGGAD